MRRPVLPRLFMLAMAVACPGLARAEPDFVLGPGDRVAVTVFKRADLSGEFRITPAGLLPLPLVQPVPISGLSLDAALQVLAERLRTEAFLLDPRVSIELAEGRPIFVSGSIIRPGSYPFQAGMTVSRAVAAAGGVRAMPAEEFSVRIVASQVREKLRQGEQTIGLMMLRRARLAAELAGEAEIAAPDTAAFLPQDKAERALDSERMMLIHRSGALNSQTALIAAELTGYRDEIAALTDQSASKQREAALATQEAQYVETLQKQGLTPRSSRVNELQRLAVQLDGERSQISAALAHAREEIARIAETMSAATNQRRTDLLTAMKEADDAISAAEVAVDESRKALLDARLPLLAHDGPGARQSAAYALDRVGSAGATRAPAQANTPLLPGDLVIVSTGGDPSG